MTIPVLFACILLACTGAHAQDWIPDTNTHGVLPKLLSFKRSGVPGRIQYGGPTNPTIPVNYATERTVVPGVPYYGRDGIVQTRVPVQPDFDEPSPFEATLAQVFQRSWYRLEWLSWTLDEAGRFAVPVQLTDSVDMSFRDNNGVRGTIGIPLWTSTLEVEALTLNQASDQQSFRDTATGEYRDVLWASDFWGMQANVILDSSNPGPGFRFSPMFGFRYINLRESIEILARGSIDSNIQNNLYGPQIGLRSQFVHPWVTLGVDAKIALSYNTYKAKLQTPGSFIDENGSKFAPVGELVASANVKVNESFSLFVSGSWLWMGTVSRPNENIVVVTGIPRLNVLFGDTQVYGVTFGGQIILP